MACGECRYGLEISQMNGANSAVTLALLRLLGRTLPCSGRHGRLGGSQIRGIGAVSKNCCVQCAIVCTHLNNCIQYSFGVVTAQKSQCRPHAWQLTAYSTIQETRPPTVHYCPYYILLRIVLEGFGNETKEYPPVGIYSILCFNGINTSNVRPTCMVLWEWFHTRYHCQHTVQPWGCQW